MQYARKLKMISKVLENDLCIVMRACLQSSRTVFGWKGLMNDPDLDSTFHTNEGIRTSRQLSSDTIILELPIATDLMDRISPQYLAELVSLGSVGTRTTESQLHCELASGVSFPIGYKNSTNRDVEIAIDAMQSASQPHQFMGAAKEGLVAVVHSTSNHDRFVILRGGKSGPNYDATSFATAGWAGKMENVVIDCSHGWSDISPSLPPSFSCDP